MQNLRLFCDVARHRSISRAADDHGLTQSAVSQRISHIEKSLGVTLLDRSVRPVRLTEAGEAYTRGCRELLAGYERLEQKVSQLRRLEGQVRVDAIYSAGIDLLSRIKERFELSHTGVTVPLDYKRPEAVYEEVREGRCDLGIVSYPRRWRNVAVIKLRDEPMAVVCRDGHDLSGQGPVHASQLAKWPLVTFETELPVGKHIRKYLREHGAALNVQSVFDNIDTIKSAVSVTDSISILPTRTVLREVEAGALSVVRLEPPLDRPLGVIHARRGGNGNRTGPAAAVFINFLLENAGPEVDIVAEVKARGRGGKSPESRVQSPESRVQSPESRVQS